MTLNRFFALLFLAITASLTWWLEDVVQTSQDKALREANNRPDFYMQDFVMLQYNIQGEMRYEAEGTSLLHYPKSKNLEIKQLDMQVFEEKKAPLAIKADTASLTNDGDQVFLAGNVRLNQDKTVDEDSLAIQSEKLFIDTNRNYMETNTPIRIQTGKHEVEGTGMQAWTDHKKIRLLNKVRGIHEP